MKTLFLFLLFPFCVFSQDTIHTDEGYAVGKIKYGKKKGWWAYYDKGHRIILKKQEKNTRHQRHRRISYSYEDSTITKGLYRKVPGRYDKFRTFDMKGNLLNLKKTKYGSLHGTQKDFQKNKKVQYRYGIKRSEIFNTKNKRYVFYFSYGMPTFRDWSCEQEKYACKIFPVAGCVVTRRLIMKADVHNFFVDVRQTLRFGPGWKEDFFRGCE